MNRTLCVVAAIWALASASASPGAETLVYKRVGARNLRLFVDRPADWRPTDHRPAIVFFYGGAWVGGKPEQFRPQSEYLATRGLVGIRVEYRTIPHGDPGPPTVCCEDAKSALRYVRAHAAELGIDPGRIAAAGGSAGGHLAAFTALVPGLDDPADDLAVSCRPQALVLFNPVFNNGPGQWGYQRVGQRYREFSPAHHVTAGAPPTIVFLGDADKLVPVRVVQDFAAAMQRVGSRCDCHFYPGVGHGFFNQDPYRTLTLIEVDKFLASLGWIEGPPTLAAPHPGPEARLAWFREAKFGLFIHWGLYALPAGEWDGRRVPGTGEWIMHWAPIPVRDYEKLAARFDPVKFDAEAWVQLAVDAGMKYIVITAKHHDGFAMFHSRVSSYNIYDATPFHRDPLKELAEACARHHIRLGFYYSQAQDWHEPDGLGNTHDFGPDDRKDFDRYLRAKAEPQVRELLTHYGPVALLWFDTPRMMTAARGQRFVDLVHSLQPACLIDGRLGSAGDYTSTADNAIPDIAMKGDWETPATMNDTWGFRRDDTDWKSPQEIIFKLVDIVSKGGNYLLNVGPDAEGVIPRESQDNLRTVGRWLRRNGAAVYGAGRSPFGFEYGEFSATQKRPDGRPVFLERRDWRCTTGPGRLYFTLFRVDRSGFDLPSFRTPIRRIYLLDDPARTSLPVTAINGARVVQLPRPLLDSPAQVVCVEIAAPQVQR